MSGLEECAQFWELQNKKNVRLEEVQSIERIMEIKWQMYFLKTQKNREILFRLVR